MHNIQAIASTVFTAENLLFVIFSVLAALVVGFCVSESNKKKSRKVTLIFAIITFVLSILMLCFFGTSAVGVKGIIYCLILMTASYSDFKTRTVENCLSVMIIITALIGRTFSDIPSMFLSAVIVSIAPFTVSLICSKPLGGGDLKVIAASAFLLGLFKGFSGLIIGLILAVVINLILKNKKGKNFPLLPYLSVGFMTAYFI